MALISGAALGGLAGPASASTAQLMDVPDPAPCGKYLPEDCRGRMITLLVYAAEPGEANRLRIANGEGKIRIRDLAATIRTGRGCSRLGRHRVSCEAPAAGLYVATAGRGDRFRSDLDRSVSLFVDGGSGNDVLAGGAGDDRLFGGKGSDALGGGDGQDVLYDAAAPRAFRAGDPSPFTVDPVQPTIPLARPGAGRDSFDGGKGHDYVSYAGRSSDVVVDLARRAPIAGQRGEHDSIVRVESATGGAGDDRLRGHGGPNELRGGLGHDRIAGREGNDYLEGGPGRNVFSGGDGNDHIIGGEGEPERFACGPGTDSAFNIDATDVVGVDCEKRG